MKKYFLAILMFIAYSAFSQEPFVFKPGMNVDSFFRAKELEAIGKPFPAFSGKLNDSVFTNDNFMGKTVFINFWFAACPPCVAEFKALKELYEKLKAKKNFLFISFTFDDLKTIKKVKAKYQIPYPVLQMSETECYRLNFGNGFPVSIILDSNGIIKDLRSGGSTEKTKARAFLMKKLYPQILKELQ